MKNPAIPKYGILTSEERGVRYLHFDSPWVQGAMRLSNPNKLELEYTRRLLAGLLVQPNYLWPSRALLIGLGAGSIAKYLLHYFPTMQVHVIEIDPRIPLLAQTTFALPSDHSKLKIELADGVAWMKTAANLATYKRTFDLIVVDGFDDNASAGELDSTHFYDDCSKVLAPNGVLSVNLFGRGKRHIGGVKRMATAFESTIALSESDGGNVVALACHEDELWPSATEATKRAKTLRDATGLSLLPISRQLVSTRW